MESTHKKPDFVVTPWDTSGKIDYKKLVEQFGTQLIDAQLLERFRRVTGKNLHPWLRRGIFFSHRAFDKFLDAFENGEPVFLYTGRGPSTEAMHIGHLIPFLFTKWMQEVFKCPLVIQISDEEKAAFKNLDFEPLHKKGFENAKEIIACGFDVKRTFIFSNRDYRLECREFENFVGDLKNNISVKQVQSIFGLSQSSSVAMYDWPVFQSAAAFWQAYPHIFGGRPATCCVPHAIDQDPYFRLARDAAAKMNLIKPTNIMCTFIPPLTGEDGKMSSSKAAATLFLTDDRETLVKKVLTLCQSGADPDPEIHKQKGGNCDMDMAYQYLRYFEEDDAKLEEIKKNFTEGKLSAEGIKRILAEKLWEIVSKIQENRSKITDEIFEDFYRRKKIELPKAKVKEVTEEEKKVYEYLDSVGVKYETRYHSPVNEKTQSELEMFVEGTSCKGVLLKSKEGYIYYIINSHTTVVPKLLGKVLKVKNLRFAEADTHQQILKTSAKICPTPFALINDTKKEIVMVAVDENINKEKKVNILAMRDDGSCIMEYGDMVKFIESLGYKVEFPVGGN